MLASVIADRCTSIPNTNTAFFYCKHDDPETLTTSSILKMLLMQQLSWRDDLVPYFAEQRKNSGEPTLASDRLSKALFSLACKGADRQYIIIDGIDECSFDQRTNLVEHLTKLVAECEASAPGKLRVLIVSQIDKGLKRSLANATEISLNDVQNFREHQEDINKYVLHKASQILQKLQIDDEACAKESKTKSEVEAQFRLISRQANGECHVAMSTCD